MRGVRKFSDYLEKQKKIKAFLKPYEKEGIYADLAIQIAKLRQENGYSQQDLAHLLNTTQQTVSRLEDIHNRSMSISTLVKLAILFKKGLRIEFGN